MAKGVVERVKSAFRFLEADYGFSVRIAHEDEEGPHLGGWVEYSTPLTVVSVVIEKLGLLVAPEIVRTKDEAEFRHESGISLERIYEYATSTSTERKRLASRDSGKLREAWKVFERPSPLESVEFDRRAGSHTADSRLDVELNAYAQLTRKYGEQLLLGNFSSWLELQEFKWDWLVGNYILSRRGKAVSAAEVEAIFWRTRNYLEALRREYGRDSRADS